MRIEQPASIPCLYVDRAGVDGISETNGWIIQAESVMGPGTPCATMRPISLGVYDRGMDTALPPDASPIMLAYAAQAAASGYVVLYRVGEFYEVLGPDAQTVSRALSFQLTRQR